MREGAERRRHPRSAVAVPVRYRDPLARPSPLKGTQAKDLSLGGLRFQTAEFVPRHATLIFEIRLNEYARPVRSIAKVAWARLLPAGHGYEVGSQFVDIVASERKALEDYLEPPSGGNV